jgi:hypothetical protein
MARCVTCGTELHPERAQKYNYCMAPECQEKNLKGLTMVAIGMNKAADEYLILDEDTREDLASGKYRDQRRGFFGSIAPAAPAAAAPSRPAPGAQAGDAPAGPGAPAGPDAPAGPGGHAGSGPHQPRRPRPQPVRRPQPRARVPWTTSQQKLALLYNEQGLRPAEIAAKLGISPHLATQIILAAKNRGKG